GPTGERRAVIAGHEGIRETLAGHERADGQPPAQRLGDGDRVGLDARLLVGPQRPRASHAALDLIEDERRAMRVAALARRAQALLAQHVDPALALDRLE